MDTALSLVRLTKHYDRKVACHDVNLDVPKGSLFGVVGPNGAGKTTAMNMAAGLLRPTHGTAFVQGHDMWTDPLAAKAMLGVMPDGARLFDRLTGRELLRYSARLRSIGKDTAEERATSLLTVLGLADDQHKLVCDYSAGMTKKIALASALVHNPRVVLLDEPFEAVDPISAQTIRTVLRTYCDQGGTVVMSSHVMELVETLCDHACVMASGRVVAAGAMADITQGQSLQQRFLDIVGTTGPEVDLTWLR